MAPVLKVKGDDEIEEGGELLRIASAVDIQTSVNLQHRKRPHDEGAQVATPRADCKPGKSARRHLVN